MPNNNKRNEKMQKRGIYFALAMCLVAIAVAGAATYESVMDTLSSGEASSAETSFVPDETPTEEVAGPTSSPDEKTEVKNTENDEDGEKPSESSSGNSKEISGQSSSQSSSEDESSSSAQQENSGSSMEPVNEAAAEYIADGSYVCPVTSSEVYSPYSSEVVYSPIMRDYRTHNGVDLCAQPGETVRAMTGGKVISAGSDLLLGNYVEIEHGSVTAVYAGLGDTFLVSEGDIVTGGMAIGSVYSVPGEDNDTPHLHLEIRQDEAYIDPMTILGE